jgi:hypothetical protein
MADLQPYIGAVYEPDTGSWCLTSNHDAILNAPIDYVLFVTTLHELEIELKSRIKEEPPHPQLSYMFNTWGPRGTLNQRWIYSGEDVQTLCDILAKDPVLNEIGLIASNSTLQKYLDGHHRDHGLVRGDGRRFRYDPKLARTQKTKRAYNRRRQGITVHDVLRVAFAMHGEIREHITALESPPAQGWRDAIFGLKNRVAIFNLLFGKNAHRNFPAFRDLLEKWKKADVVGKRRIRDEFNLKSFANWLDAEVKARRPKPSKEWKPKRFDFPYQV